MPTVNSDYTPDTQDDDGLVTLPAKTAEVHGVMVRYEPLPHKNTLGFWTRVDDWVSWEFVVKHPGAFDVEILQGCGDGSGGSQVEFRVGQQSVTATVVETGGFQSFVPRRVGSLTIAEPGRYSLVVKPLTKPHAAVMDLRQVRLLPVGPNGLSK
jgi:arylsulfatase A